MESRVRRCDGCGAYFGACGAVRDAQALAAFDADQYIDSVAGIGSITVQANDCTGYAFWPSTVGRGYSWLGSRDLVQEVVAAARRRGLWISVEYNALHAGWFWDDHPEARIVDRGGLCRRLDASGVGVERPLSPCCPNSTSYLRFAVEELRELCSRYDLDELSLAFVHWPEVCYCHSCRTRFHEETGHAELPRVVDWMNPDWTLFQRKREQWLSDYARTLAAVVRTCNHRTTVALRADALSSGWRGAPSLALFSAVDRVRAYPGSGRVALSFGAKFLRALSPRAPFELLAEPACPALVDRVGASGEVALRCALSMAALGGGTLSSSPPVDSNGMIVPARAAALRRLARGDGPLDPLREGTPFEDVGIFVDLRALFDLEERGEPNAAHEEVDSGRARSEAANGWFGRGGAGHAVAASSLARSLAEAHIPCGIFTSWQLDDLSRYRVIALPQLHLLGAREIDAFTSFVREGGCLYASGPCGLLDEEAAPREDFPLAELFGVSVERDSPGLRGIGRRVQRRSRCPAPRDEILLTQAAGARETGRDRPDGPFSIAPTRRALDFFEPYDAEHPVRGVPGAPLVRVRITADPELLATVDSEDDAAARRGSAGPRGAAAGCRPVVIMNHIGKGRAMYAAVPLEAWDRDDERRIVARLFRHLIDRPFTIETDAPRCVETALWRGVGENRFLLHLLNFQSELPNVPVRDVTVRAHLGSECVRAVRVVPSGRPIDFELTEDGVELTIPRLDTYLLIEIA